MSDEKDKLFKELFFKLDTAVWCWNIKKHTGKNTRCKVDWKSAFDELSESYWSWRDKEENEKLEVTLDLK